MKTQALLHALDKYKFDAALRYRHDEEKSRAKERIFSFRNEFHQWDPKTSARNCGTSIMHVSGNNKSIRVFPRSSNWTELDIWQIHPSGKTFL